MQRSARISKRDVRRLTRHGPLAKPLWVGPQTDGSISIEPYCIRIAYCRDENGHEMRRLQAAGLPASSGARAHDSLPRQSAGSRHSRKSGVVPARNARMISGVTSVGGRRGLKFDLRGTRALIFDVDGTLYRQRLVRRGMAWRLFRLIATRPGQGLTTLRVLRAYRRAQEALRIPAAAGMRPAPVAASPVGGELAFRQLTLAACWTGLPMTCVSESVERWMERVPLDLVRRARRSGLDNLLAAARRCRLRLGVCSDYPAVAKLAALGLERAFDVVVTAQDPEVGEFKPSPRGLKVTLARLGVAAAEALYVGDRPDVDGAAAAAAGVPCLIVGRRRPAAGDGWVALETFADLARACEAGRCD